MTIEPLDAFRLSVHSLSITWAPLESSNVA